MSITINLQVLNRYASRVIINDTILNNRTGAPQSRTPFLWVARPQQLVLLTANELYELLL